MSDEYYIVSSKALPEVFAKVVQAKRLLGSGAAHSASEAARMLSCPTGKADRRGF